MGALAALVRWDWFALARRRLPWVLLACLLVLSQLPVWGSYFRYRNLQQAGAAVTLGPLGPGARSVNCRALLAGNTTGLPPGTSAAAIGGLQAACRQSAAQTQRQLAQTRAGFSLPGSIPAAVETGLLVGLLLLAILTAAVVGTEYGWGAIRPTLARGTGRVPYLAAKLVLVALLAGAALLVVALVTAGSSALANGLASGPPAAGSTSWGDAVFALGKTWAALRPAVALTAFVTVLTRSTAAGMALAIGYFLGEQLVVTLLSGAFGWFGTVSRYLLGQSITAWIGHGLLGPGPAATGTLHAFLVLLVYTLALGGAAFALFATRDVTGASGG